MLDSEFELTTFGICIHSWYLYGVVLIGEALLHKYTVNQISGVYLPQDFFIVKIKDVLAERSFAPEMAWSVT